MASKNWRLEVARKLPLKLSELSSHSYLLECKLLALRLRLLLHHHFGDKFPLGADEDVDAKEKALRAQSASILSGSAFTKRDGTISESGSVKNKPHTNYGGK